jgi:hypothetical protein
MIIIDSFNIHRKYDNFNNIYKKKVTCVERENNYNNINDDNNNVITRYNLNIKYKSNYNIQMLSTCKSSEAFTTTFSSLSFNRYNDNNYHQQYHQHNQLKKHKYIKNSLRTKTTTIIMSLIPINKIQINKILTKQVNTDQWLSYWGNNKIERLQRVLESVLIAYGGAWLSWFFSFMAGGIVSAFLGR